MNKWAIRVAGIIMVLMFLLLFANLKRQLEMMQVDPPAATRT